MTFTRLVLRWIARAIVALIIVLALLAGIAAA